MQNKRCIVRVGACESPPDLYHGSSPWKDLVSNVHGKQLDFLLLNELFAGEWLAIVQHADDMEEQKLKNRQAHEQAVASLGEFEVPFIAGSRCILDGAKTVNEAFVWSNAKRASVGYHTKQHLPDDEEYFEAHWCDRGEPKYEVATIPISADCQMRVGFMICTEVFFNETARRYKKQGVHLIAIPRATPANPQMTNSFKTACAMAAIVSGAYVISSNRAKGPDSRGVKYGAEAWIFDPKGNLIKTSAPDEPVIFADIDLMQSETWSKRYPAYVAEIDEPPRMRLVRGRGRGYIVVPEGSKARL
eukprot:gnl/MRDRNA2_/MRDRNA2_21312_c0_seq1.p1 gnl/MRDRNA2_/MRDRNA2_21312_c0~~gnl/MRDRNA2_/MRDRNA2_21312_c0_seq1.p1  ORF type:complete len:331 (-),score=48.21 gnl/MRDRNA2_/MRDRNA2_21312_c0_seq1:44-952(-)